MIAGTNFPVVLIRGGGDLASGVAFRLHRVGVKVMIAELSKPMAVRRTVAFSEAVYQGEIEIEGVIGRRVDHPEDASQVLIDGEIPVLVDPGADIRHVPYFEICAVIDARMTKNPPDLGIGTAPLVIGLGPGFNAGQDCDAVIETNRGHFLGRVIWSGKPEPNTGIPGKVGGVQVERVLRAPSEGFLQSYEEIGGRVKKGQRIASVSEDAIISPFDGTLRGLLPDGMNVKEGMKIGDLDPRLEAKYVETVSDKALAIGGGVLEALLTRPEIRNKLWS